MIRLKENILSLIFETLLVFNKITMKGLDTVESLSAGARGLKFLIL